MAYNKTEWIKKKKQEQADLVQKSLNHFLSKLDNDQEMHLWVKFIKQFHNYSIRNQFLIMMQSKGNAVQVAGFKTWFKKYGRKVVNPKDNEILIFAPVIIKELDENTGKEIQKVAYYKVVAVYDVSSTTGKELPSEPEYNKNDITTDLSKGQIKKAIKTVAKVFELKKINLTFEKMREDGRCMLKEKKILINKTLDEMQTFLALIHEYGHYLLHSKYAEIPEDKRLTATEGEMEAESVAYVVGRILGINSEASSRYVQKWGGDSTMFQDRSNRILTCSMSIVRELFVV